MMFTGNYSSCKVTNHTYTAGKVSKYGVFFLVRIFLYSDTFHAVLFIGTILNHLIKYLNKVFMDFKQAQR